MTAETEFSFRMLPGSARRHIRTFQLHQFLDRFAMGLPVAVVALALADRGMDLFQISLLFGIYAVTTLTMELPFGGLADAIGRKPVFLTAVLASLISVALFLVTRDFYILAVSFAFIGLGRALRSGTLDAWFVERFKSSAPEVDIQPALAMAQTAGSLGLATGAVLGGFLPDVLGAQMRNFGLGLYDVSYAASFCVMTAVFVFTVVAIDEIPRAGPATRPAALVQGGAQIPQVVKTAGLLALRHPALLLVLLSLAFFLMATNPVEVLWPTVAKSLLNEAFASTAIGILTATYFFAIAFGAFLSPYVSRIFKRRAGVTLAATFACLGGVQIALAMQEGIQGFVTLFILYSVFLGISETPAGSLLHGAVGDHQRSTLLSLKSLMQQLGAALGLVLAGAIANIYSTSVAWSVTALFLGVAAVLALVLARKLNATKP